MSGPLPLAGLRVLDLSRDGAAAACARLLALLGAGVQAEAPAALARVPSLAAGHDIVLTDLPPAEAAALGLEPSSLLAPSRVVVSATAFGLDGPAANRTGPLPPWASFGPAVDDALTGAHAALAVLAALRWARRQRRGVLAEIAALEVIATCLGDRLPCPGAGSGAGERASPAQAPRTDWQPASPADAPVAEASPPGGRLAVLPCADGYVGLAAPTAFAREDLAALSGVDAVRAETADLGCLLAPWLRARTRLEIFHAAQLWRLPVVPVLVPAEALADEQCAARDCWRMDGEMPIARSPFRFIRGPLAESAGSEPTRPFPLSLWQKAGVRAFDLGAGTCPPAGPRPGGEGTAAPALPPQPLADLRVLDLGMVWAGPYCGRLLAGLGADVIKVEGPTRPDGTRAGARGACPGVFADLNRGKASLVLDLSRPPSRDLFLQLARRADVVVESFSPRVLPNFGLDYAALAAANPRLLLLSMPAFGATGPWRDYVAYGSGLELATGLAAWPAAGPPLPAPVPYLDYLAGAYGALGILAALLARDRADPGGHLEVAQREVACQVLGALLERGERPGPWTLDPSAVARASHLAARRLFVASGRGCPGHHYARPPWRLHGVPAPRERPAPAFGADTRRLLRDPGGPKGVAVILAQAKVLG